ncbi:MAG: hypothetical protein IPK28_18915 [Devosia sp.]|nr:hypothetical protein [Devosia sp.]
MSDSGSGGDRHDRLSAKLRENLRRRKEQSRARAGAAAPLERGEAASAADLPGGDDPDDDR